jgi:ankyrin repeat protein
MTSKRPIVLWFIVVLLLLTCGLLMWFIQSQAKDLGPGSSTPAMAPTKPGAAVGSGGVQVATLRDAIAAGDWTKLKTEISSKNVDPNAQMQLMEGSRRQMTLLAFATLQGNAAGVQQLLAMGAEPDVADSAGITPLMLAAAKGDLAMLKALLDAKARVDSRNKWGQTALMMAAQAGENECVKALLAAGANSKAIDEEGNSVLAKAAGGDASPETIKLLLDAKPDLDAANNEGVTPLMRAADRGDAEKVVVLLNAGAKTELKDKDGRRALEWAQQRSDAAGGGGRVVELLTNAKR